MISVLDQVNQFVLRKQHLTEETRSDDIVQTVRDVVGLHATGSTTPYLSLFSRTRDFTRDKLDRELYVKRSLGKIRCVRKTVYVLPRDVIPVAFAATRSVIEPISVKYSKYLGVSQDVYEDTSRRISSALRGKGMTTKEIKKALGTELNISPIVNLMCDKGLLIRGEPKAGWKSNMHTYRLFHEYFPGLDLNVFDEEQARKLMVEQYLASFGPATEDDVAWWTGFPKGQTRRILRELEDKVSSVEISGLRGRYLSISSDRPPLIAAKPPGKSVLAMLPCLDPYLMGYKDRERYLDNEYYDFVFDRSGNATSTILVDGRVTGVWDIKETLAKIFLFTDLEANILERIRIKAEEVGRFISRGKVDVRECDSMIPLPERTAGGVMAPLKYS